MQMFIELDKSYTLDKKLDMCYNKMDTGDYAKVYKHTQTSVLTK